MISGRRYGHIDTPTVVSTKAVHACISDLALMYHDDNSDNWLNHFQIDDNLQHQVI